MESRKNSGDKSIIKRELLLFSLILISSIFIFGCGTTYYSHGKNTSSYKSEEGKTALIFDTEDDGEFFHWKAVFEDDELVALYKNGKKIPTGELEEYEDMVYDRLDDLRPHKKRMSIHFKDFPFDKEEFKEKMDELKEYFKEHNGEWNFNSEEFKEQMKKFKEEMKKLKDLKFDIQFDGEELEQSMRELKESLKELKIHPPEIEIDTEVLRENIRKMTEELRHQKWVTKNFQVHVPNIDIHIPDIPDINIPEINIDIPEIDIDIPEIDLSELEKDMEKLDLNMKELDKEMKKLDAFIKDLKSEMVKDGLLKSVDEEAEIDISEDGMDVNDVKVPDNLFNKYKEMYKEHFGKELEHDSHFKLN